MRNRSRGDGRDGGSRGSAALLLLADSRLPAGGHAHSGGAEEAVRLGMITGSEDLARFLRGRLATTGLVTAALSAAACEMAISTALSPGPDDTPPVPSPGPGDRLVRLWRQLDAEADARTASPAQREAGRTQGRLLLRTARRMWPSAILGTLALAVPDGPHHPLALGATAASAGCEPYQAALAAAYNSVTGPATAAVRLLGLDPVTVHRLLADMAPALNDAAQAACASLIDSLVMDSLGMESGDADLLAGENDGQAGGAGWPALPGHAAPALDLLAEGHLKNTMKLFVS
jgi:urease accessory protein